MKRNNIRIIGIPEEEEEQGMENLFEKVMMENFANLMREKVTQIQERQRVPIKRNPKRPTARHIKIKMAKFQEKKNQHGGVGGHAAPPRTIRTDRKSNDQEVRHQGDKK